MAPQIPIRQTVFPCHIGPAGYHLDGNRFHDSLGQSTSSHECNGEACAWANSI